VADRKRSGGAQLLRRFAIPLGHSLLLTFAREALADQQAERATGEQGWSSNFVDYLFLAFQYRRSSEARTRPSEGAVL
jgi:hypothetical protein